MAPITEPGDGQRLCSSCQTRDLAPILPSPHHIDSAALREIRLDGFKLSEALENNACPLCRLITRCARLSGLELPPSKKLRCSLRPRIIQSHERSAERVRDQHSGQIHVEFYHWRLDIKKFRWLRKQQQIARDAAKAREKGALEEQKALERSLADMNLASRAADTGEMVSDAKPAGRNLVPTASEWNMDNDEEDVALQTALAMSLKQQIVLRASSAATNARKATATRKEPISTPTPPQQSGSPGRSQSSEDSSEENTSQFSEESTDESSEDEQEEESEDDREAHQQEMRLTGEFFDDSEAWEKVIMASLFVDITASDVADYQSARLPLHETVDLPLLQSWLSDCQDHHQHLAQVAGISAPLSTLPLAGHFRAIHTSTGKLTALDVNHLPGFVALSYVWGNATTHSTASEAEYIYVSDYPSTIRDALLISKDLGFDWLWVDRICVDQSNETEKARVVAHVKDIFAAAELTIVAASGSGVHFGLPGVITTPRTAEEIYQVQSDTASADLLPTLPSFNAMLHTSSWRTRAWTFEEHAFSRRLLWFFPTEASFTCASGTYRESTGMMFKKGNAGTTWGDEGKTPPTIGGELHAKFHKPIPTSGTLISAREFVRAVEEYSSRRLTFEEDRVKAFAGIIAAANQGKAEEEPLLLHGHPLHLFETLLTWHHDYDAKVRPPIPLPFAPSWSWAAAGSAVRFLDNGEDDPRSRWFQYNHIDGFDLLGLPREREIPLVSNLGLQYPSEIIADEPWELGTVTELLPSLHLVTVVFEGLMEAAADEQHCLRPLGSTSTVRARLVGPWSIGGNIIPALNEEADDTGDAQRCTFALVGGFNHMYIMLLRPSKDGETFSRLGLFRVSLLGHSSMYIVSVMAKGNARWQYIRLV